MRLIITVTPLHTSGSTNYVAHNSALLMPTTHRTSSAVTRRWDILHDLALEVRQDIHVVATTRSMVRILVIVQNAVELIAQKGWILKT